MRSLGGESTPLVARTSPQVDVFVAVVLIIGRISANGLVVVIVGALAGVAACTAIVGDMVVVSKQPPSHPYLTHDVVGNWVATFGVVVGDIVVVSRQPPNHPYFTHDVVGKSDVDVDEPVDVVEVVVSSRHPANISSKQRQIIEIHIPHHPGVLQVVVRVGVAVVELVLLAVLVDGSEPLLRKNFQLKQSTHSSSDIHLGTSGYASITS